ALRGSSCASSGARLSVGFAEGGSVRVCRSLCLPLFLLAVCAVPLPSCAQGLPGQIGGSVVDSSKGVLPGATVTVKNTATQVTRETVTDANGSFIITNVIAGTYDIKVTLASFKT